MIPVAPPTPTSTPPVAPASNSPPSTSQNSVSCPANPPTSGTGSTKHDDELEQSTRSIQSPADGPLAALDRGSATAPGSRLSSHIRPILSRPSQVPSSLTSTMPLSQSSERASSQNVPPPRPSTLLPLLRCASCRLLLEAPTTLNCGHTVCSKHMSIDEQALSLSRASSSSQVELSAPAHTPISSVPLGPSYRSRPLACPVESCRPRQPARVRVLSRSGESDPHNGVTVTPATDQISSANAPTVPHNPLRSQAKLDVTVSKLLEVITTAARAQTGYTAGPGGQLPSHSDSDSDDDSDDDATQSSPRPRYPQLPRSMSSDRNGDDISPESHSNANHNRASSESPPRPRKRQRIHVPVQTATGVPDRAAITPTFEKELLSELTCEICFMLLHQPITTPCQHVSFLLCLPYYVKRLLTA